MTEYWLITYAWKRNKPGEDYWRLTTTMINTSLVEFLEEHKRLEEEYHSRQETHILFAQPISGEIYNKYHEEYE